jgi:hypothetical protein
VATTGLSQIIELADTFELHDTNLRRIIKTKLQSDLSSIAQIIPELAAWKSEVNSPLLLTSVSGKIIEVSSSNNGIELNQIPSATHDVVAFAFGDDLTNVELLLAKFITSFDLTKLLGFEAVDDATWNSNVTELMLLNRKIHSIELLDFLKKVELLELLNLMRQIAHLISNKVPVIVDGSRALLAASTLAEINASARSWVLVADQPRSPVGTALVKAANWSLVSVNGISIGDGMSAIAAISLLKNAAIRLKSLN